MKLKIHTVLTKKPPPDEPLILWNIVGDEIIDVNLIEAEVAIPDNEERKMIPSNVVPDMIWSNGFSMYLSDKWSYANTK